MPTYYLDGTAHYTPEYVRGEDSVPLLNQDVCKAEQYRAHEPTKYFDGIDFSECVADARDIIVSDNAREKAVYLATKNVCNQWSFDADKSGALLDPFGLQVNADRMRRVYEKEYARVVRENVTLSEQHTARMWPQIYAQEVDLCKACNPSVTRREICKKHKKMRLTRARIDLRTARDVQRLDADIFQKVARVFSDTPYDGAVETGEVKTFKKVPEEEKRGKKHNPRDLSVSYVWATRCTKRNTEDVRDDTSELPVYVKTRKVYLRQVERQKPLGNHDIDWSTCMSVVETVRRHTCNPPEHMKVKSYTV